MNCKLRSVSAKGNLMITVVRELKIEGKVPQKLSYTRHCDKAMRGRWLDPEMETLTRLAEESSMLERKLNAFGLHGEMYSVDPWIVYVEGDCGDTYFKQFIRQHTQALEIIRVQRNELDDSEFHREMNTDKFLKTALTLGHMAKRAISG